MNSFSQVKGKMALAANVFRSMVRRQPRANDEVIDDCHFQRRQLLPGPLGSLETLAEATRARSDTKIYEVALKLIKDQPDLTLTGSRRLQGTVSTG
jgi:hypothetical protein